MSNHHFFGKAHETSEYNGFQIVDCGLYESRGWRLFEGDNYISNLESAEDGINLVDKILEAKTIKDQYVGKNANWPKLDLSVCVVSAKKIIDGQKWYGVQFHDTDWAKQHQHIRIETKIESSMYLDFASWYIVYIV